MPFPTTAFSSDALRGRVGPCAAIVFMVGLSVSAINRYRSTVWYYSHEEELREGPHQRLASSPEAAFARQVNRLRRAIELDPGCSYNHYGMARLYMARHKQLHAGSESEPAADGLLLAAWRHLQRAIERECVNAEYHYALAWVYDKLAVGSPEAERFEERRSAQLRLATELDAGSTHFPFRLGVSYQERGLWPLVMGAFRESCRRGRRRWPEIMARVWRRRHSVHDLAAFVPNSFAGHITLARFLIQKKRMAFANAELVCAAGLTRDRDVGGRERVARTLLQIKAPRTAIRLLHGWLGIEAERALVIAPDAPAPLVLALADTYLAIGDKAAQAKLVDQLCQRSGFAAQPALVSAVLDRCQAAGRSERAVALVAEWRAQRLDPPDALAQWTSADLDLLDRLERVYVSARQPERAVELLEAWRTKRAARGLDPLGRWPAGELKLMARLAAFLCEAERHADAARLYDDMVRHSSPGSARDIWCLQLTQCYFKLGCEKEAYAFSRRLLMQAPERANSHYVRALVLERRGNVVGAIKECDAARQIAPRNKVYARKAEALGQRQEKLRRLLSPDDKATIPMAR